MVVLEQVYQKVNGRKHPPFQYFVITVLSMTLITNGAVPLVLTFLTSTKGWQCLTDKCDPEKGLCEQDLNDEDWYSPVSKATDKFLKDYKVYCGYDGVFSAISSGYFAGFMIGILIGGKLMDLIGRHKTICFGLFIYCFTVVLHAASKSDFKVFAAAHLLSGIGTGAVGAIFVYQTELTISSLRNFGCQVHGQTYSFGMLYGALLCYFIEDFTLICIYITIPAFVFNIILWKYVPESPFWLHQTNQNDRLIDTLDYIAKFNNIAYMFKDNKLETAEHQKSHSALTLFTFSKSTCRITCIFLVSWLTASFCYWGLSFNVGEISGSLYVNQALICLIDLINRPINYYGIKHMNRVSFLKYCNIGMAFSALVCMLPYEEDIFPGFGLSKISALIGRMIADLYFSTIYLHTSEVLPTVIRGSGLSICSSVARIGSIMAPFVLLANKISPNINYVLIFASSIICYLLYSWVPETRGRLLPGSLCEMDDLIKGANLSVKKVQNNYAKELSLDSDSVDEV